LKAIVQDAYGSPDVLELRDIDKPVVGDDDLLVPPPEKNLSTCRFCEASPDAHIEPGFTPGSRWSGALHEQEGGTPCDS